MIMARRKVHEFGAIELGSLCEITKSLCEIPREHGFTDHRPDQCRARTWIGE